MFLLTLIYFSLKIQTMKHMTQPISGPLEVLIKTKWYRANAAISDNFLGISLDEDQPEGIVDEI